MSIPLYFTPPSYVPHLRLGSFCTLKALCGLANVACRASGPWTNREIELVPGEELRITAEPGDWGKVRIEVPPGPDIGRARLALAALAYGLNDLVAKESLRGCDWTRVRAPRGRPVSGNALTNRERQRRFRARNY